MALENREAKTKIAKAGKEYIEQFLPSLTGMNMHMNMLFIGHLLEKIICNGGDRRLQSDHYMLKFRLKLQVKKFMTSMQWLQTDQILLKGMRIFCRGSRLIES